MATDTKERILDSAELLFAEHGIATTSLRMLTEHAGVNLAAVNYHFQSKDALVQAVLFRLMNPVNQRRMTLLDALLASPNALRLEDLLDAFYRPMVEVAIQRRKEGRPVAALYGRLYTEPGELMTTHVRSLMGDVARRFTEAFGRAVPGVDREKIVWRLHFTVGVLAHVMGASPIIETMSRGMIRLDDTDEVVRQMVEYAAGGFRAGAAKAEVAV